ncbi:hypothetical protein ACW9HR_37150 [Nocardia gipuzkoensis]
MKVIYSGPWPELAIAAVESAHAIYTRHDLDNQRRRAAGDSEVGPLDGDCILSESGLWQVVGVGLDGLPAVCRARDRGLLPDLMVVTHPLDPLRWRPSVSVVNARLDVTMTDKLKRVPALFHHRDGRLLTCGFPVRVWQATGFAIDEN